MGLWAVTVARLLDLQRRRPAALLAVGILSAALAALAASRLELRTGLGELLPEDAASVRVAEEVAERLPVTSTLAVVAEGGDARTLRGLVDRLGRELEAIDDALAGRIDTGPGEATAFFAKHGPLYASLDRLEAMREAARARFAYELHRQAGLLLDENRDGWTALLDGAPEAGPAPRHLDPDRPAAVVLVRTPIAPGDLERTDALRREVRSAIERAGVPPGVQVGLSGNLLTAAETYRRAKDDLAHVGLWGVSLVLSVVLLYFRGLRPLIAIGLGVGIGTAWTFGLTALTIGHLNAATGFLVSIVVGNGINVGVVLVSAYLHGGGDDGALERALVEGWRPTLVAALAAGCAYGSLAVTDFRGFWHFAVIGGSGMLLCWLSSCLFVPPTLVRLRRLGPMAPPRGFGRPLARLAQRRPRAVLAAAGLVTIATGAGAVAFLGDPIERDLRRIDNTPPDGPSEARRLVPIVDDVAGRQSQDGLALAVDDRAQVAPLVAELERRREDAAEPPFGEVVTAQSLLPARQDEKLRVLREIERLLDRAAAHGLLGAEERARLGKRLGALERIDIDDLPASLARPFTERDGSRGRLVYIAPADGQSVWDGRYLERWAAAIRHVELPDGTVVRGSGRSVIFADLLAAIAEDAPRATLASVLATLLLVLVAFRARAGGWLVVASVLLGLVWTVGVLPILGSRLADGPSVEPLRLSFLSFVGLPLTVGIGADYAVHVMRRLEAEPSAGATTGAVVLCSLTTLLGYGVLTLSINGAVRSFGRVAVAGEIASIAAATVVLPAAAALWRAHRSTGRAPLRSA